MEYLVHIAILICIYGILGITLNLIVGEAGLLSVTHAAFYGAGAYATALLMVNIGANFFVAAATAMVISAAIAYLVGFSLARLRGDYYVFGTLGFNVIAFSILLNWDSLTRGPLGIPGIPRPSIGSFSFLNSLEFLALAAIMLFLVYTVAEYITTSSFGRVLRAIREDEEAIEVFGYHTSHYKLAVFVIAAALASLAGSLFATYITFIDPSSFTVNESIFVLAIIILGGLGSVRGALLGAIILVVLPEALRFVGFPTEIAAQMRQIVYGLMLILLMLFRPQGILGKFRM